MMMILMSITIQIQYRYKYDTVLYSYSALLLIIITLLSIGDLVIEYDPATVETRVRFPVDTHFIFGISYK